MGNKYRRKKINWWGLEKPPTPIRFHDLIMESGLPFQAYEMSLFFPLKAAPSLDRSWALVGHKLKPQ
jgi:hypothetical protein